MLTSLLRNSFKPRTLALSICLLTGATPALAQLEGVTAGCMSWVQNTGAIPSPPAWSPGWRECMAVCSSASIGLGTFTCPNQTCEPWCGSGEEDDGDGDGDGDDCEDDAKDPALGCSNRDDGPPDCPAGNPISITTGNKYQKEIDFATSGPSSLAIERHYNSLQGAGGWRFSYRQRLLAEEHNGGRVLVNERDDGSQLRFALTDSQWHSWSDVTTQLEEQVNINGQVTGHTLTFDDLTVEHYNSDGDLTRITRPFGPAVNLTYSKDADGQTRAVTIASGGTTLEYALAGNQITSASTTHGEIRYEYDTADSNKLLRVIYPDSTDESSSPSREYRYDNATFPTALTGIVDESGVLFAQWEYDDQGLAISSSHAGDANITLLDFTFSQDSTDPRTTVTNSLGKKTTYHFQPINGKKRVTLIEGHQSDNCVAANRVKTYDENGLVSSSEDWNGNITRFQRDEQGRETLRIEAAGTEAERRVITHWHPTRHLRTQVIESGRITHYDYDAAGRVIATRITSSQPVE